MKCLAPRRITKNIDSIKFPQGIEVPCGQCLNCRLQKREEWVARIIHESDYHESMLFLTLTYSDEYCPVNHFPGGNGNSTLEKKDLQLFFKRLRKNSGKKIKYFACGEYGEKEGRPHYHCIIFGLDLFNHDDIQCIKDSWKLCDWKSLGKKPFGDVSTTSIRYVVSYLEKSILGKWQEYAYEGIEIPFHVVSNGLGKNYAIENKEVIKENGFINVQGYKRGTPRYYKNILELEIEKSREYGIKKEKQFVQSVVGLDLTRDELYMQGTIDDNRRAEEKVSAIRIQNDKNLKARDALNKRRYSRDT